MKKHFILFYLFMFGLFLASQTVDAFVGEPVILYENKSTAISYTTENFTVTEGQTILAFFGSSFNTFFPSSVVMNNVGNGTLVATQETSSGVLKNAVYIWTNATAGTHNVNFSGLENGAGKVFIIVALTGVNTTNPISFANGTNISTKASINVTTTAEGRAFAFLGVSASGDFTEPSHTKIYENNTNDNKFFYISHTNGTGGIINMSQSPLDFGNFVMTAFNVRASEDTPPPSEETCWTYFSATKTYYIPASCGRCYQNATAVSPREINLSDFTCEV